MQETHARPADRPASTWVARTGRLERPPGPGLRRRRGAGARSVVAHFSRTLGLDLAEADGHALYNAVVLAVRERLVGPWRRTRRATVAPDVRRTSYLSLEFLMGRALGNAIIATGLDEALGEALESLGVRLADIEALEPDAGLGNGGLGRLAACFLDSCAALGLPVTGYGLRYRYGMFRQAIEHGRQVERPDAWLQHGHPWETERRELACRVKFGGHVEVYSDAADGGRPGPRTGPRPGAERGRTGRARTATPARRCASTGAGSHTTDVVAVPHDVPVPGAGNGVVNTLRLWEAQATDAFDLDRFNAGGYAEAVAARNEAENITMVLYPNDASENGKALRLRQQYFLVSASLQDALRIWLARRRRGHARRLRRAPRVPAQRHAPEPCGRRAHAPARRRARHGVGRGLAHGAPHDGLHQPHAAARGARALVAAADRVPAAAPGRDHPRDRPPLPGRGRRALAERRRRSSTRWRSCRADHDPMVRMAHLAIVGSFSVNGVAELHSNLLRTGLFADFAALYPERFNNKTNGVTQRRWLRALQPGLSALLDESVGTGWVEDMAKLEALVPMSEDEGFRARWRDVKRANRERLGGPARGRAPASARTRTC